MMHLTLNMHVQLCMGMDGKYKVFPTSSLRRHSFPYCACAQNWSPATDTRHVVEHIETKTDDESGESLKVGKESYYLKGSVE